jgi:cystathionine gamma-lyase
MEAWLGHRSLLTFELRFRRQCINAHQVAEYLSKRSDVTDVRYPGLKTDPSHEIASRQMAFFGSVIAFVLPDRKKAEAFLAACQLVIEATSFGGLHTTAERRARWGGDDIPDGFIRLSVGCEDVRDIIEDLTRALDAAHDAVA